MKPNPSLAPRWGVFAIASALAAIGIVACGGGSDGSAKLGGDTAASTPLTLSGTAATGAPIASAAVEARCATGSASGNTNADGSYSLLVSGGSWPCIVRVSPASGPALYSVAAGPGSSAVADITPATQLVTAAVLGADPEAAYTAFSSATAARIVATAVAAAQSAVIAYLASAGVDFSAAGNLFTAPAVTSGAYESALVSLTASLARGGTTLAMLSSSFVGAAANGSATLPPELAFSPAAGNCPSLRSATYRLVTPLAGANLAAQSGLAVIDAAALAITHPDGTTGTWAANGSCRFSERHGSYLAEIVVTRSGVMAGRYSLDGGAAYSNFFGFPEQSHSLSELNGDWNSMGLAANSASSYTGVTGSVSIDAAGRATASSTCRNDSTWSVAACVAASDAALALLAPLSPDSGGGFDQADAATHTVAGRLFAYRSGSGNLMLASVGSDGQFSLYTPQQSASLPALGSTSSPWEFDMSQALLSSGPAYQTSNDVVTLDPAAGSYTRLHATVGIANGHLEPVFINNPRAGYLYRPAGSAATASGSLVNYSEFTSLGMRGMDFGAAVGTARWFELWIQG